METTIKVYMLRDATGSYVGHVGPYYQLQMRRREQVFLSDPRSIDLNDDSVDRDFRSVVSDPRSQVEETEITIGSFSLPKKSTGFNEPHIGPGTPHSYQELWESVGLNEKSNFERIFGIVLRVFRRFYRASSCYAFSLAQSMALAMIIVRLQELCRARGANREAVDLILRKNHVYYKCFSDPGLFVACAEMMRHPLNDLEADLRKCLDWYEIDLQYILSKAEQDVMDICRDVPLLKKLETNKDYVFEVRHSNPYLLWLMAVAGTVNKSYQTVRQGVLAYDLAVKSVTLRFPDRMLELYAKRQTGNEWIAYDGAKGWRKVK